MVFLQVSQTFIYMDDSRSQLILTFSLDFVLVDKIIVTSQIMQKMKLETFNSSSVFFLSTFFWKTFQDGMSFVRCILFSHQKGEHCKQSELTQLFLVFFVTPIFLEP